MRLIFAFVLLASAPAFANSESMTAEGGACVESYACYPAVTVNAACPYAVVVQNLGDRSKFSSVGCFKSLSAAKVAAKQLAKRGKCEYVDSE